MSSMSGGAITSNSGPSSGGPDGLPVHDETSQQSTLSQSSDRSDGRQTPSSKTGGPTNFMGAPPVGGYPAHSGPPGSPHSSAPSPGGSMGSSSAGPETGYSRDLASPNWQHRTAPSPISGHTVRSSFYAHSFPNSSKSVHFPTPPNHHNFLGYIPSKCYNLYCVAQC